MVAFKNKPVVWKRCSLKKTVVEKTGDETIEAVVDGGDLKKIIG